MKLTLIMIKGKYIKKQKYIYVSFICFVKKIVCLQSSDKLTRF